MVTERTLRGRINADGFERSPSLRQPQAHRDGTALAVFPFDDSGNAEAIAAPVPDQQPIVAYGLLTNFKYEFP
jgi:hypothetical protein